MGLEGRRIFIALRYKGGIAVYNDEGVRLWSSPGWPLQVTDRYLVTRQEQGIWLHDREGKVVARYPPDTYLTRDGKAMVPAASCTGCGGAPVYRAWRVSK